MCLASRPSDFGKPVGAYASQMHLAGQPRKRPLENRTMPRGASVESMANPKQLRGSELAPCMPAP
jgi:hypothetical protein